MSNYNIENKRKKLIFRSNHRGTKELDLVMGLFAAAHVPDFTENELLEYEDLLQENDPDMYNWIAGIEKPPERLLSLSVFQKLLSFKLI